MGLSLRCGRREGNAQAAIRKIAKESRRALAGENENNSSGYIFHNLAPRLLYQTGMTMNAPTTAHSNAGKIGDAWRCDHRPLLPATRPGRRAIRKGGRQP
jgi:hypothetical protein